MTNTFWTIFLAVLAALWVWHLILSYIRARERNRIYCLKKALRYTLMGQIAKLSEHDASLDAQQAVYWKKQARSLTPIHPTESEQEQEWEQSQDDEICQLIKERHHWSLPDNV